MGWKANLPGVSIGTALLLAGCGLDVAIMGPTQVTEGETAMFQIKLTNVSACPVSGEDGLDLFGFVPFVQRSVIDGDPILEEICLPTGNRAVSASLADEGTFPISAARSLFLSAAAGAAAANCSGPGFMCEPVPPLPGVPSGGVICTVSGNLAPGEMRTVTCEAEAVGSGQTFNLAGSSLEAFGVCKAGVGQGQPCDGDGDCGADCGTGICVMGGNAGNGCDDTSECPMGTCTDCSDSDGLGADCTETRIVGLARAPVVSPIGLIAIAAALCAVAAITLRRSRRGQHP